MRDRVGDWASDLTRDADTAMYRSKDRGGNAVTVFDDSMREQVARRLSIESELRRASPHGDLEVHYQTDRRARYRQDRWVRGARAMATR